VRVLRVIKNGRPFRVVLNDLIPCSLRLFCLIILFGFGFGGLGWNSEMSDSDSDSTPRIARVASQTVNAINAVQ
jgi:hypothetical protein